MLLRNMRDPFLEYVTNNDIYMVRSYLETYYHTALLKNERGEATCRLPQDLVTMSYTNGYCDIIKNDHDSSNVDVLII